MTPAKNTKPSAPQTSLDDLLSFEDVVPKDGGPGAPAVDDNPDQEQTETPSESAELVALRAQLEAAQAQLSARTEVKAERPKPESELTPEQRQIRELQDQLARANGKKEAVLEYEENTEGGILVHFLSEQTFTSNNRSFYKGQEVTFGPEAYKETVDRYGNSWINLTDDEQYARWGEVKFRKGPWPGKRQYDDAALANVSIATQAPTFSL